MPFLPVKRYADRILKIATPAVAGLSSQMVVSIIDTAMVGRLENSAVALASMGLGVLATWTLTAFFSSLATGTHILVARRQGEGNYSEAGTVLNNSLVLAFLLGGVFGFLGYYFSHDIIGFFSSDEQVAFTGGEYMKYRSLGLPFFLLAVAYRGFFYGIGHTKIFLVSAVVSYLVNIAFNYFLIFGTFGFPSMGVAGAGLAASIGMCLGCLYFIVATFLPYYRKKYRYYEVIKLGIKHLEPIIRISLPVSFQNILILFGFLIFVAITGIIGTQEQAATQVVITALFLSFMPCFGLGIAAQTLVGNALGNKEPDEAYQYGVETAKIAVIFTLLLGVIFVVAPELVLRIITSSDEVIDVAKPIL
ncbi:MAG TPA: MATE family efflux transporter, partial [Bacteroidota bacterium]